MRRLASVSGLLELALLGCSGPAPEPAGPPIEPLPTVSPESCQVPPGGPPVGWNLADVGSVVKGYKTLYTVGLVLENRSEEPTWFLTADYLQEPLPPHLAGDMLEESKPLYVKHFEAQLPDSEGRAIEVSLRARSGVARAVHVPAGGRVCFHRFRVTDWFDSPFEIEPVRKHPAVLELVQARIAVRGVELLEHLGKADWPTPTATVTDSWKDVPAPSATPPVLREAPPWADVEGLVVTPIARWRARLRGPFLRVELRGDDVLFDGEPIARGLAGNHDPLFQDEDVMRAAQDWAHAQLLDDNPGLAEVVLVLPADAPFALAQPVLQALSSVRLPVDWLSSAGSRALAGPLGEWEWRHHRILPTEVAQLGEAVYVRLHAEGGLSAQVHFGVLDEEGTLHDSPSLAVDRDCTRLFADQEDVAACQREGTPAPGHATLVWPGACEPTDSLITLAERLPGLVPIPRELIVIVDPDVPFSRLEEAVRALDYRGVKVAPTPDGVWEPDCAHALGSRDEVEQALAAWVAGLPTPDPATAAVE